MKRFAQILLVALMAFGLAGCFSDPDYNAELTKMHREPAMQAEVVKMLQTCAASPSPVSVSDIDVRDSAVNGTGGKANLYVNWSQDGQAHPNEKFGPLMFLIGPDKQVAEVVVGVRAMTQYCWHKKDDAKSRAAAKKLLDGIINAPSGKK
jgi:hypothetical protein